MTATRGLNIINVFKLLVLCSIACVIFMATQVTSNQFNDAYSHAVKKHKTDAELARDCFRSSSFSVTYMRAGFEDRRIRLCFSEDLKAAAIQVIDKAKTITNSVTGEVKRVFGIFETTAYMLWEVTDIPGMLSYATRDMGHWGEITYVSRGLQMMGYTEYNILLP